ncbi:MAG: glycosyltransferase family 4 protein [Cyclobacteriaceae bacterium]
MNIGIFCDSFYPESKAVAVRLYHMATGLSRQQHHVTVHTCTRGEQVPGIRIVRNWLRAPSNESSNLVRLFSEFLLGFENFIRILFSRYDLVIISSPPFIASVMGVWAARLRKLPYVIDVRDEYPKVFFIAGLLREHSIPGRVLSYLERSSYAHARMIVSVTERICNRIQTEHPNKHVYLLRNGFDEALFKPSDGQYEVFTTVFHGNIGKFQRPDLIIDLARHCKENQIAIRFLVIGWGQNDRELQGSLPDNMEFLGQQAYTVIPSIISKAHVGLSFRTDDEISLNSFPVKVYEYIGVGIPVLVTPISEAGSFIENQQLGFQFTGHRVSELADILRKLAFEKTYYQSLRSNVVQTRARFSRTTLSDEFAKVVGALLNNKV